MMASATTILRALLMCLPLISADVFNPATLSRMHLEIFTFTNVGIMNKGAFQQYISPIRFGCSGRDRAPLEWSSQLYQVAQRHSVDMQICNNLDHTSCRCSSGKCDFVGRTRDAYPYNVEIRENIGMHSRPTGVVMAAQWFESGSHCNNLFSPGVKQIGVGYSNGWSTQDLGGYGGPSQGQMVSGVDVNGRFIATVAGGTYQPVNVVVNGQSVSMDHTGNGVYVGAAYGVGQCSPYYFEIGGRRAFPVDPNVMLYFNCENRPGSSTPTPAAAPAPAGPPQPRAAAAPITPSSSSPSPSPAPAAITGSPRPVYNAAKAPPSPLDVYIKEGGKPSSSSKVPCNDKKPGSKESPSGSYDSTSVDDDSTESKSGLRGTMLYVVFIAPTVAVVALVVAGVMLARRNRKAAARAASQTRQVRFREY